jgi:hypothetical protein
MSQERFRIFKLSVNDYEGGSDRYIWTWRDIWQKDFDKLVKSCIREIISAEFKRGEDYIFTEDIMRKVYYLLIAKHGFHEYDFDGTFSTFNHHLSGLGSWIGRSKANRDYFETAVKDARRDLGISALMMNRIIAINRKRELKEKQEQKKKEEEEKLGK